MLVFDISLEDTSRNVMLTRNFSIAYSAFIVIFILISVFLVHYRFVRKSLRNFQLTIGKINQGQFDERLTIPEFRELGELGKSFNTMVHTIQKTREELENYHKKEIQEKQKMASIGEMTSRLAHEIRNPLTGIANAVEILVNQFPDEENRPVLEEIRRQALRVNNTLNSMLRFSRSNDLNVELGNINDIIEAVLFFIKNQTNHKRIEFRQDLQTDIPVFRFDREHIENALLNIGLNAIQAISQSGIITFKTQYFNDDNQVLISVEDNGNGMSAEVLAKIFDPFYTTRTEGTGLGLAITREIIEKHGGEIWADSQENKGSVFFISLPLNQPEV